MKVIKFSLESEEGKYEIFISDQTLLSIMDNDFFKSTIIDAKTRKSYIPGKDITTALKIETQNKF